MTPRDLTPADLKELYEVGLITAAEVKRHLEFENMASDCATYSARFYAGAVEIVVK